MAAPAASRSRAERAKEATVYGRGQSNGGVKWAFKRFRFRCGTEANRSRRAARGSPWPRACRKHAMGHQEVGARYASAGTHILDDGKCCSSAPASSRGACGSSRQGSGWQGVRALHGTRCHGVHLLVLRIIACGLRNLFRGIRGGHFETHTCHAIVAHGHLLASL